MELLDIYDENGNHIGTEDKATVHKDALWHKTVHCWLYDKNGNVFFQRRKDRGTLYTTASGHLKAGETIEKAFNREIKEEIGLDVDASDATFVESGTYVFDLKKPDGSLFKDRVFYNVYVDLFEETYDKFNFDEEEVTSLALVNAKEALKLFKSEIKTIKIKEIFNGNITKDKVVDLDDFLINDNETFTSKYGKIMEKVIELTEKEN